jgi:hypothetical protein
MHGMHGMQEWAPEVHETRGPYTPLGIGCHARE